MYLILTLVESIIAKYLTIDVVNAPTPIIRGPICVTWGTDGSVDIITYDGVPLITRINDCLSRIRLTPSGILLPQTLTTVIDNMLEVVATLLPTDRRRKIYLADKIFEHLVIHTEIPNPKLKTLFWNAVLNTVWAWEDTHEKVHKGTAYYFMAETFLASGDVPSAYICFFNALEDDKENFPYIPKDLKDAPAYRTTSLVDNRWNTLYEPVVVPLRKRLQGFINEYKARTNGRLTIQTVDQKFLQADQFEETKMFFVATFHEIYHLAPLHSSRMINNDYSKLKIIDTLFNLGLVVNQLLEQRFLSSAPKEEKKIANAIYHLALHLSWTTSAKSRNPSDFLKSVRPHPNSGPPDKIVPTLLDGSATFDGRLIDYAMRCMLLAYHLRNFAGHHVEGQDILVNRYNEVLGSVMSAFFVAIEVL